MDLQRTEEPKPKCNDEWRTPLSIRRGYWIMLGREGVSQARARRGDPFQTDRFRVVGLL